MSLPALSRADRLLLSIVLLLAVLAALAAWLLMPPEKTGGVREAAFDALQRGLRHQGRVSGAGPAGVSRRPASPAHRRATLEGIGVLFVLKPVVGMTDDEVTTLEDVGQGGARPGGRAGAPDGRDGIGPDVPGAARASSAAAGSLDQWFAFEQTGGKPDEKVQVDLRANPPVPGWQPSRSDPLVAGIGPLVPAAAGGSARPRRCAAVSRDCPPRSSGKTGWGPSDCE